MSAWIAVPCASPLIHGGVPPPKAKKYSQAVKPPRCDASATMRSSSARSSSGLHGGGGSAPGGGGASGGWQARHSALALPKFASGWIWRPWPGYHWKTTGSPSNVTRPPPSPAAPVHGLRSGCGAFGNERVGQNSALRCSWRKAAGIRVDVSNPRRASDSTPATTARSSPRRPLRIRLAVARARR